MRKQLFGVLLPLIALLIPTGTGSAQVTQPSRTLAVTGYSGTVPILQINGKSYVEVEALARLTNGSISFHSNQTTLTFSAPPAGAATPPPTEPPAKKGFSADFLKAGIEAMTAVREWRIAIVRAIQSNYPLTEDWVGGYRRTAESKVALASAAVATDDDRNGLPLLRNEFGNMQKLSDKYLGLRQSLTYISPDSLESDALDQQLLNCSRGLQALAASGHYQDVPSCH